MPLITAVDRLYHCSLEAGSEALGLQWWPLEVGLLYLISEEGSSYCALMVLLLYGCSVMLSSWILLHILYSKFSPGWLFQRAYKAALTIGG